MTEAAKKSEKVEDFDHFADDWWDPKGRLSSLHRITPIRYEYFKDKAGALDGKRLLDIGCGGGLLSERFALDGALVTGIDLSPTAIKTATAHARVTGGPCADIEYRKIALSDLLAEAPEPFDVILCSEVLEHVDDLSGLIRDACSLLAPGGLFLFSTINKTLKARFFAIFVAEELLGMLPSGTHDYDRFIRPSTLVRLFSNNGLEVGALKGLIYDPLKRSFKLGKDTSINYLGYAIKETS